MLSLRTIAARRAATTLCTRCLSTVASRNSFKPPHAFQITTPRHRLSPSSQSMSSQLRTYASKSTADSLIEEIQDQYATAKDEFEIATEETEKNTTYAPADREAAREELEKLKGMYEDALKTADGEEVKGRVGGRIRELDNAVTSLEEKALEEH